MVKSAKGKDIDMSALREVNGRSVAIGNARMNAQGDLLGRGGKIVKTREELAREYYDKTNPETVKTVAVSQAAKEVLEKQQKEHQLQAEAQKANSGKTVKIAKETKKTSKEDVQNSQQSDGLEE
jgi:lysyl-tRNA synthetase class I